MANPRLQIQSGQHSGRLPGIRCQVLSSVVHACPCKTFQVCPSMTFLWAGVWLEEHHNKRPLWRSTALCCLSSNGIGNQSFHTNGAASKCHYWWRLDSCKQQYWNVLRFCGSFRHVNTKCQIDVFRIQVLGDECPTLNWQDWRNSPSSGRAHSESIKSLIYCILSIWLHFRAFCDNLT